MTKVVNNMNKQIELKYEFFINASSVKLLKLNYTDLQREVKIEKHNLKEVFGVELQVKRKDGENEKATLSLMKNRTILDQKDILDADIALLISNEFTEEIEFIKEDVISNVHYMIIGLKLTNY